MNNIKKGIELVNSLRVVNDVAERGITSMEDIQQADYRKLNTKTIFTTSSLRLS